MIHEQLSVRLFSLCFLFCFFLEILLKLTYTLFLTKISNFSKMHANLIKSSDYHENMSELQKVASDVTIDTEIFDCGFQCK